MDVCGPNRGRRRSASEGPPPSAATRQRTRTRTPVRANDGTESVVESGKTFAEVAATPPTTSDHKAGSGNEPVAGAATESQATSSTSQDPVLAERVEKELQLAIGKAMAKKQAP